MPRRPSSVRRICSLSMPVKKFPMRKVRAPRPLIICPSVPSCAITVAVCCSSPAGVVHEASSSTGPIVCACCGESLCASAGRTLTEFSASCTVPIFWVSLPETLLAVTTQT